MNAIGRLAVCALLALAGTFAMQAHAQYGGRSFVCKSENFGQNYCSADTRGGVTMVRRISNADCIEGRTWGYNERGVWVTQGCEAEFVVGRGGGWHHGGDDGSVTTIHCESAGYNRNFCRADTSGGVRLMRQDSSSACIRGRSWDYDQRGIWVSNGCSADFTVGGYDNGPGPGGPGDGASQIVRCESIGNRTERCPADTSGGVRLVRRLSGNGCSQGRDWGWDRGGIWVSGGCRADFQVGGFGRGYDH